MPLVFQRVTQPRMAYPSGHNATQPSSARRILRVAAETSTDISLHETGQVIPTRPTGELRPGTPLDLDPPAARPLRTAATIRQEAPVPLGTCKRAFQHASARPQATPIVRRSRCDETSLSKTTKTSGNRKVFSHPSQRDFLDCQVRSAYAGVRKQQSVFPLTHRLVCYLRLAQRRSG